MRPRHTLAVFVSLICAALLGTGALAGCAYQDRDALASDEPRPSATPETVSSDAAPGVGDPIWWDGPARGGRAPAESASSPRPPGGAATRPAPIEAPLDGPEIYEAGCIQRTDAPGSGTVLQCAVTEGAHRVVLTGASHAIQFFPALRELAGAWDWELLVVSKEGCRFALPDESVPVHPTCAEWNAAALPVIRELDPDLLITVGSTTRAESSETLASGELALWRRLAEAGMDVVAIRDTPRFAADMPACVAAAADLRSCGRPRAEVYAAVDPMTTAPDLPTRVYAVDVADLFCGERWCPAVVDGVLVYRDASHVTETYAETLTMPLRDRLRAALPPTYTGGGSAEESSSPADWAVRAN